MDDSELTRLRATFCHWQIDIEQRVFTMYVAARDGKFFRTDSLERLEAAMTDADAGRTGL